jgi:hypothetical protein
MWLRVNLTRSHVTKRALNSGSLYSSNENKEREKKELAYFMRDKNEKKKKGEIRLESSTCTKGLGQICIKVLSNY